MTNKKWETGEDNCPKCEQPTEILYQIQSNGQELAIAERCLTCHWELTI